MSSAQDDTFSPHNLSVFGVLLLIAVLLGEVVFPRHGDEDAGVEAKDTIEDIAMRLQPVVTLDTMLSSRAVASSAADSASKTPDQLYQGACFACHGTGVAGAPKLGDAAAWSERLAKGIDELVGSAIKGVGAMPPKGGSQYSDDQIRAVVEYILAESK